jgi:hypothetical protein
MEATLKRVSTVLIGLLIVLGLLGEAFAWEVCTGHVIEIEPDQMPATLLVRKDCVTPSCPTTSWVYYSGSPAYGSAADNTKALYAEVLAALVAGKNVSFYLSDGTCTALTFHIVQ